VINRCIALLFAALAVVSAHGVERMPAAGSLPTEISSATHAWIVVPSGENAKPLLVHLPPRGPGRAEPGAVHPAIVLEHLPERLAAFSERVYMIDPPAPSYGGGRARSVRSIAVTPRARGDWVVGAQGRMLTHPSLPGDDELLGFVAVDTGPVALTKGASGRLRALVGSDWIALRLPDAHADPTSRTLRLVALPGQLGVVDVRQDHAKLWTVDAAELRGLAAAQDGGPVEVAWDSREIQWPFGSQKPSAEIVWVAGDLLWTTRASNGLDIWSVGRTHALYLARIESDADGYAFVPLASAGRVAVLLRQTSDDDPADLRMVEVSVYTGDVIYDGPIRQGGPVNGYEMRLVMAALAALMVIVLLVVLRLDSRGVITLPDRVALARPGPRIAAGIIDLALVAFLVAIARGVSPIAMLNLLDLLDPGREADLILVVGSGFVLSVIGEWLFGRTLGKAILGCRVISLSRKGEDRRPTLRQAVTRNAVRWLLPPVALIGLLEPDGRHRGDTLARTVVVVDIDPAG